MLKYIISIMLLLSIGAMFMSVEQKSAGPPGCFAGEPPNFTNCTYCHSGAAVNSGTANIGFDLGGAELGYVPDSTYTITLSVQKAGMEAAGFQFIALQNNNQNNSPGVITLTDPTRMQIVDVNNPHAQGCSISQKKWVEHEYAGILSNTAGLSQWSFLWKAPSTDVGTISFYFAGLESNYNLGDDGDFVYTRSASAPFLPSSIQSLHDISHQVLVYPNPTVLELFVEVTDAIAWEKIELIDLNGRVAKNYTSNGLIFNGKNLQLDLLGIQSGIYILSLQSDKYQVNKRVLVL